MKRYRILEKKGHKILKEFYPHRYKMFPDCEAHLDDVYCIKSHGRYFEEYISRFIVQKNNFHSGYTMAGMCREHRKQNCPDFIDLKEFDNLEDARAFKRDLELDEGIEVE